MMMVKKQPSCVPNTTPSSLGLNKDSQTISKLVKPKIWIIHIFAPEIIKTDVENFRELVQRLTGKPPEKQSNSKKRARVPRKLAAESRGVIPAAKKMELRAGFQLAGLREKIKGEDEIWSGANSGGGFLGGLPEFDGFMEELNHIPFPILPLDVPVYNPADNIAT
ncbi:PREDICTED: VQ motif-containing protein 25 isoform X3 [Ipomoea nil]|uniref:VQ motif-containing protein 25 isoform X2 n=1 Tax=Ipomoea nil TaxID=35883 RepID=UPI000900D3E3|nr:PREDICTED: VQ motif-containing protein 25 isoform X2 [Ipomoea nil]XP_019155092.1 PREDICTED: VQ motif-containing protein 25 isoform X3 [Ipomoea nil]